MRSLLFVIFCLYLSTSFAQISINEICADNESVYLDEEGDYEDWIELYNAGNNAINLEGYFLSDDISNLAKWSFPNIEISANGFLLVFASSKDFNGQDVHTNFKVSKEGETLILSDPQLNIIDQIESPILAEDQSYGRQPDGSTTFNFFNIPSPKSSNNNSLGFNFAIPPTFDNTPHFNSSAVSVALDCEHPNCVIYYTLDGNPPTENDFLYQGPITIDSTKTIRASAITPGLRISEPATRTFFINEKHFLPIMALTTAPDNLWDPVSGIFVKGPNADTISPFFGANFWSDIEIPIYMEYFEEEVLAVEYPLGAKIHGGSGARTKPMKPLRLLAKKSFGTDVMEYRFFKNRPYTDFQRLVLRNSSGDYNICHMRDEFLARYFINEGFRFDGIAEQPIVVYINGQYHGVMHLREKIDKRYLKSLHGIDPNNIDLLEEDTANIEGTFEFFDIHKAFVMDNDLSEQANFDIAAGYFDLNDLTDYIICQTFVNNTDWPTNNMKYWRPRVDGAKWRYLLFDMDVAMALQGWSKASVNSFNNKMQKDEITVIHIFKSFLENEGFRRDFINRYADLINTSFRADIFAQEITRSQEELSEDIKRHLPKWGKTYDGWLNIQMPKLYKFANERPMYARRYLAEYFELPTQDQIGINTYPANAGSVQINTIEITSDQLPWDGIYFNTVPIRMTIQPENGFTFSHWESNFSEAIISISPILEVQPRNGEVFTAIFGETPAASALRLFPNPSFGTLDLRLTSVAPERIDLRIYDTLGREVFSQSDFIINTGVNHLNLNISHLDEGTYILHAEGTSFSESQTFLRIIE